MRTVGRSLLVIIVIATSIATSSPAADALRRGDELDLTSCMWRKENRYDGAADGFGGIDRHAYYGLQYLRANLPGGHFRFRGQFPHARFFGFQSYDEVGEPIALVRDSEIRPDRGSQNPFADHVAYRRGHASYTLDLIDAPAGDRHDRHTLYGGYRENRSVDREAIEYRIYLPDRSDRKAIPGGVPMPRVYWVVTDPMTTAYRSPDEACAANQSGATFRAVYAGDQAMVALNPFLRPATRLAGIGQSPPRWTISVQEQCCFPLYPNLEAAYLATTIAPLQGQVLAYHFKLPTFPDTQDGELISQTQVRYWSICTLQAGNFFYTDDCLYDAQMHRDRRGYVTVALSAPEDRPSMHGRPYADWLEYPGGGPMIFVRYVDSAPTWRESPFRMPREAWYTRKNGDLQLQRLMQEYYPRGRYCAKAGFELGRC